MTTPTTQSTKTLFAIILLAVLAWAREFHPLGDNYQKRIIPGLDKIDLTNQKTGATLFIGKVQEFTVNLINSIISAISKYSIIYYYYELWRKQFPMLAEVSAL
ncbi:MAG: hypothetical protein ACKODM_05545 [Cytophagales bacterium]